jgi:hypothetical protein
MKVSGEELEARIAEALMRDPRVSAEAPRLARIVEEHAHRARITAAAIVPSFTTAASAGKSAASAAGA